ncbi:shikimate dehydrogenase [Arthrobacter sp. VKM Ac-2550]|uniref:shikimate dehydrogenase n=1 Tax=Crystallibacter permensis TaxID=1938888 RepID=UPI002227B861|nr:shikimate dehydrogenase [Arthrobacter sp. VKM Ac-2550]MCW2131985.1 shikimate dehydrogenase [Arthrobacter sp. VKM Ac-2550]
MGEPVPARRAAVLGHPISHSRSPLLHGAAYGLLGFDCAYEAIDLTPEQLPAFMAGVRENSCWAGLSVTMPLKAAMVPLMDETSDLVRSLGVLNTVVVRRRPDGTVQLAGQNTDVAGIIEALRHAGATPGGHAAILGGGGTAAAAAAALAGLQVDSLSVCLRDPAKAGPILAVARNAGLECRVASWDDAAAELASAQVVVSTLPPRAADPIAETLAGSSVRLDSQVLLDVTYDPWPSRIAAVWAERGGAIVPGLEMLIYQAVEQVRLFTGMELPKPEQVINVMCDAVGAPRR